MDFVTPEVHFIGQTGIDVDALYDFLATIGAEEWDSDAPTEGEKLIEFLGRLCYKSWKIGLNPNVTKIREHNSDYLKNLLSSSHGSVLEAVTGNFVFHNVSRVFCAELERHRVGTAISQESLRFVRLENLNFWLPSCIETDDKAAEIFERVIQVCEDAQKELAVHFDLDNMKEFAKKKVITSAMRRIAPEGLGTTVGWSANIRTLRHCIEMRTSRHAEEEIRFVFDEVGQICKATWPNLFADYTTELVDGINEWNTPYRKV